MRRAVPCLCLNLALLAAVLLAPAAHAAPIYDAGTPGDLGVASVTMSRLPIWVQVITPSTALFSADAAASDSAIGRLAQFTFLRVLGGGASRLQIDVFDENGTPGLRGWVDPTDVLPSAPGTDWRVAATSTVLRNDAAQVIRSIDRFTPLQQLDGAVQNRIPVRVYRSDFTVLDQGWVDLADAGPAFPPTAHVPSATPLALHYLASATPQQAFLDATAPAARAAAHQTGVPASVTVAQAILESDWGRSELAEAANNYFGIKATSRLGNDGLIWLPTSEYDATGAAYDTVSPFRAYKSLTDSMTDHDRLLLSTRYSSAMEMASDPRQFAQQLYETGYSTDPAYADKLISLMDRYDLYRLDA